MWFILVPIAVVICFYWFHIKYSYWKLRGVPGPDPIFIAGNVMPTILRQKSLGEIVTSLYRKYDGHVVGFYRLLRPCLIVKDLDIAKTIIVKEFGSFHDNEFYIGLESDAAFGGNPFTLKGEEWKEKRSYITGSFTTGKVKTMFSNIKDGAQNLSCYLGKLTERGSKMLEAKELCCLYTLETVFSCAYTVEARVFENPDSPFFEMGQKLYYSEYLATFKFFLSIIFPKISKFIGVRFTNKHTESQLFDVIRASLEYRDKNNVDIKDFLTTIASLREKYTEKEILALAAAFYLDGQETTGLVSVTLNSSICDIYWMRSLASRNCLQLYVYA
ncbi:unnamed protein product [Acanthoscelides obtectus]|uniref:Cytochrome P450 n=1 Tax=Acanthoscelides obtectus TaxID=200917 RepID=A0A9P0KVH4_ACAOB|nr:unnamed protein product [Acanthoscelides obtectus]CAK1649476.1 Cytochrome P450 6k1 [Acanthoscelides obtectus]